MGEYTQALLCQALRRKLPDCYLLVLLGLFCLLPEAVLAQCQGSCPPPPAPSTPTVPASPDTDGNYTVTTSYGLGSYGFTRWNTGQDTPQSGSLSLTNRPTGSYTYQARSCYTQGTVCGSWSGLSSAIYVIRTPANPAIDVTTSAVCGSLNVSWSPGTTGYPTPTHAKLYDLQVSTNGGGTWTDVVMNTSTTAWGPHPTPAHNTTYEYRVRAWYTWSGYTSLQTGWITDSVTYQCPPAPNPPVLSHTITNTQITASWTVPQAGTLEYHLERRDVTTNPSAAWSSPIYSGANTSHTDTGATTLGNTYQYRVKACNPPTNCSGWSNIVEVDLYQHVNLGYQYDALGRLKKVTQNGTVKTGYCYDDAGNRDVVTANGGGDNCANEQPPPAPGMPTGLSRSLHSGNGYNGYWTPGANATHYELRVDKFDPSYPGDSSTFPTVQGGSASSYSALPGYWPVWIRACSTATGTCSAKAYF